ncbi:MAG: hypothetical protein EAZ30_14815 [Betaproteobacteria bacterium]|nr:MAG: hypothetical protein EAZ30_14815 [Betaproteobacteria bacterium]
MTGSPFVSNLSLRNDLDIDSSATTTKYDALTDGMMVMRYLLGATGPALTRGVKSQSSLRTDCEIEAQLAVLRDTGKLDVDGTLPTRPESDGLLILRYLLGYRGSGLTQGITSVSPDTIESRILALLP